MYTGRNGWRVLLMKDRKGFWTFPKGKIEDGESLEQTASREITEEVGISKLSVLTELTPSTYWYHRGEDSIKKTVHYFLFRSKTLQDTVVQTDEGIMEARWVSWDEAKTMIGYPETNMPLLLEAQQRLREHPSR